MKRRQRLIAMLLSFGLVFGLCESGVAVCNVHAQEVQGEQSDQENSEEIRKEAEQKETEDVQEGTEETQKEPENVKKEPAEAQVIETKAIEDYEELGVSIISDRYTVFPGEKIEIKASLINKDVWGTGVPEKEIYDCELKWTAKLYKNSWDEEEGAYVPLGEFIKECSIEPITDYPGAVLTIPDDLSSGEDDADYNIYVEAAVYKDGKEIARSENNEEDYFRIELNGQNWSSLECVFGEESEIYTKKMVDYLKKALIYGHTSRISS